MAPSSRFGWPRLLATFLLLLSLFNIAISSPLPDDRVDKSLVARARPSFSEPTNISVEKYEAFLKAKWPPSKNKYVFYTGGTEGDVKKFIAANKGFHYYGDLFNAPPGDEVKKTHPWWSFFDEDKDLDDGENSSIALAKTVTGDVYIFGGVEWKSKGMASFFAQQEITELHKGLKGGRISSINHMARGATSPSQIIAKEDAKGELTWMPGHKAGEQNAKAEFCKRGRKGCDAPKLKPKPRSKCKRANGSTAACPIKSPTGAKPKATPTPTLKKPTKPASGKGGKPTPKKSS